MNIEELQSIMIDSYQVGYMEAVKAYEPSQDFIRLSEVKKWLKMMKIDLKRFNILVHKEIIKPVRKGIVGTPLFTIPKKKSSKPFQWRMLADF